MAEFFIPDSSPVIAYSDKDATSQWRATYAMQGDNFDQTLHTTTTSQASLKFNISATRLTIQVPPFANCTSIISINESIPVTACSSPASLFTLDGLPTGLHRVEYGVGDLTTLVDTGDELVLWGIAGSTRRPPQSRNVTVDNAFANRPASDDGSVHPISLDFQGDWQHVAAVSSASTQTVLGSDSIDAAFNRTLSVTEKKGAQLTFKGHGSAIYLYGNTGADYGAASVSLNGVTVASSLDLRRSWSSGYDLLWYQDGLDALQENTMVLTNLEDRKLAVDFMLFSADDVQVNAMMAATSGGGFLSKPAGKAVIYGVLPLVVCALVALLACLYIRRRRRRQPPRISVPSNDDEKSHRSSFHSTETPGSVFFSYSASDDYRRESNQMHTSDRSLLSPADSYKMATLGEAKGFQTRSGGHSPDSDLSPATDRTYQLPYERIGTVQRSPTTGNEPFARPQAPTLGGSHASTASIDGQLDTLASLAGTGRTSLVRIIQEAIALGGAMSPRSTTTIPPAYSSGVSPVEAAAAREKFAEGDANEELGEAAGPSAWNAGASSSRNSAITGRRVGAPSIISMIGAPPSLARLSTASSGTGLMWEDFGTSSMPPLPRNGSLAVNTNVDLYPRPVSVTSATPESILEPKSATTSDFHRKAEWPIPPVPALPRIQTERHQPDAMSIGASLSGAARPDSELYHYESPLGSNGSSPFASTPSPGAGRLLRHRASSSFAGSPLALSPGHHFRRLSAGASSPDLSQWTAARIGAGLLSPASDRNSSATSPSDMPSPAQIRQALKIQSMVSRDSEYSETSTSGRRLAPAPPINMAALGDRKAENPSAFLFSGVMGPAVEAEPAPSLPDEGRGKNWKEALKWKGNKPEGEADGSFLSLGAARYNNRI